MLSVVTNPEKNNSQLYSSLGLLASFSSLFVRTKTVNVSQTGNRMKAADLTQYSRTCFKKSKSIISWIIYMFFFFSPELIVHIPMEDKGLMLAGVCGFLYDIWVFLFFLTYCEENPLLSHLFFDMLFMHINPNKYCINIDIFSWVKSCVCGLLICFLSNDSHLVADYE